MSIILVPRTAPPQDDAEIDFSNPITRGLMCAVAGRISRNLVSGEVLVGGSGGVNGSVFIHTVSPSVVGGLGYEIPNNLIAGSPFNGIKGGIPSRGAMTLLKFSRLARTDIRDTRPFVGWMASSINGFNIGTRYTVGFLYAFFGAASIEHRVSLKDNNWHLLGLSYDGERARLWKDGAMVGSVLSSAPSYNFANGYDHFYVGGGVLTLLFDRSLSEVEHDLLAENPWRIFKPSNRTIFRPSSNIITAIVNDLKIEYTTRTSAIASLTASYAKRTSAFASLTGTFSIQNIADIELVANYLIVGDAVLDLEAGYDVCEAVSTDIKIDYALSEEVATSLPINSIINNSIIADQEMVFALAGVANSHLQPTYTILNSVLADLVFDSGIRETVLADLQAAYALQGGIGTATADLMGAYAVVTEVMQELSASYVLMTPVLSDLALPSMTLASAQASLTLVYERLAAIALDLPVSYEVLEAVHADLAADWMRLGATWKDLGQSYIVFAGGGIPIEDVWASQLQNGQSVGQVLLDLQAKILELHLVHGLDASAPLVVGPSSRTAGDVLQSVVQLGETVTVKRA